MKCKKNRLREQLKGNKPIDIFDILKIHNQIVGNILVCKLSNEKMCAVPRA